MTEEGGAEPGIGTQRWKQILVAFRNVEVDGGGNLPQVANRLVDESGARLALINIQSSSVIKGDADVMVPPKGVIPWQPIHENRGLVLQKTKNLGDLLLVGTEHPVRVDDPFRHAG